jgi:hypothetical protein
MNYYILSTESPDNRAMIGSFPDLPDEVSWFGGRRITDTLPTPLMFELMPEGGTFMPEYFKAGIPLMRDDLIARLKEAGVTNLDCYPALIRDARSGEVWANYKAVNIVGVISCANMKKSTWDRSGSEMIDVDFDGLVIDETRTNGCLFFRLAECVTAVVVHENVRRYLDNGAFPTLRFIPPSDWIG